MMAYENVCGIADGYFVAGVIAESGGMSKPRSAAEVVPYFKLERADRKRAKRKRMSSGEIRDQFKAWTGGRV